MCGCTSRKIHPTELLTEYCPECGRIWVNTLCGESRPTNMFHRVSEPLGGVWVGNTFFQGAKLP